MTQMFWINTDIFCFREIGKLLVDCTLKRLNKKLDGILAADESGNMPDNAEGKGNEENHSRQD